MVHSKFGRSIVFVFSLFLIFSLVRSIWSLLQKENVVIEEEKRLASIKKQNEELNARLKNQENDAFIEKQAREKLGLGREGDYVILLPPITPMVEPTTTPILENWQKWVQLYLR